MTENTKPLEINAENILPSVTGIDGTDLFSETVCPGYTLCFDIFTSDANPNQTLTMKWDNGIKGGSFTVSGERNPTGHFCWTPLLSDARTTPYILKVTVQDNAEPVNGVTVYDFIISVPNLKASVNSSDVTCNGKADGIASVTVSGGSGNYSYLWSHQGETTETITNLSAGTYSVYIMDDFGCEINSSATISEASPLLLTLSSTPASSVADVGTAEVNVSGGTMPYSYAWSPEGGNNIMASGLQTGIYTVVIKDANGCSGYRSIIVESQNGLELTQDETSVPYEIMAETSLLDGIENADAGGSMIQTFPNPVTNQLFIKNPTREMLRVSVINSIGESLYESINIIPNLVVCIPMEDLAPGIYLLKARQKNEIETSILIKQ